MKIGVISDTHDDHQNTTLAFDEFSRQKCELVIHCGDWTLPSTLELISRLSLEYNLEVTGVFGNMDEIDDLVISNSELIRKITIPQTSMLELEVDGKIIAVVHGHEEKIMKEIISGGKYNVLFTGHTHRPLTTKREFLQIINPGSVAFSESKSLGFIPTVAIYDTKTNEAKIVKLKSNKIMLPVLDD